MRKSCAKRVLTHQTQCRNMWGKHIELEKQSREFYFPGPADYGFKNFIQDEPSFPVHGFQKTVRPFNKVNMKQQTETIEYMAERRVIQKLQPQSDYKGCK